MTPAAMLDLLQRWRAAGRLRALDLALARFVHGLDAAAPASLLLATALLAQLEGRGHSCLPLEAVASDAAGLMGWTGLDVDAARSPRPGDVSASEWIAALAGWPPDAAEAHAAWGQCGVVQVVGPASPDARGTAPLVLSASRLYLRRYWRDESQVARHVLARTLPGGESTTPVLGRQWDAVRVRAVFRALFPSAVLPGAGATAAVEGLDHPPAPDWQQVACALALRGRLTLITGGPGTGKTHTAARVLMLQHALHAGPLPLRVALAAPTGKAAARLRQSILAALSPGPGSGLAAPAGVAPMPAVPAGTTLHALLGTRPGTRRFRHDADNPLPLDLLFVDEASMVHLEMMAALLDALPATASLVLLGDKDQLASVEAGAVLGDLCQPAGGGTAFAGYRADTAQWVRDVSGQVVPADADAAAATARGASDLAQQTVTLRHSHRFVGPIARLASAVNRGDSAGALLLLRPGAAAPGDADNSGGAAALLETSDVEAITVLAIEGRQLDGGRRAAGYRAYLELLAERPAPARPDAAFDAWACAVLQQFDRCRVLCAVREGPWGVAGLNAAIERAVAASGLVARRGTWYPGRPVIVSRNDPALGVFNGDIGVVLQAPAAADDDDAPGSPLRVYFLDGSGLRSVAVGRLADADTAFAMTVHKSQGSEFEHVLLVLPDRDVPVLTRELLYTGITRARQVLTLVANDAARLRDASARLTQRLSGLRALL